MKSSKNEQQPKKKKIKLMKTQLEQQNWIGMRKVNKIYELLLERMAENKMSSKLEQSVRFFLLIFSGYFYGF